MPIDPERQQKAKEYARIRHCLWAFDLVLSAFALIAVLALGLVDAGSARWVDDENNPWRVQLG